MLDQTYACQNISPQAALRRSESKSVILVIITSNDIFKMKFFENNLKN